MYSLCLKVKDMVNASSIDDGDETRRHEGFNCREDSGYQRYGSENIYEGIMVEGERRGRWRFGMDRFDLGPILN
jgi:hypothetical protein